MLSFPSSRALILSALTIACALPMRGVTQTSFSAHPLYNSPDNMSILAHGDFNNDGREDLIVTDYPEIGPSKNLLFLSNGDGTYDAPITLATTAGYNQLAVGDFNHDGKLDFAAYSSAHAGVDIYFGNGDGTFNNTVTLSSSSTTNAVVAADLNHDGSTDVIILSSTGSANQSGLIQTWLSSGTGSFSGGSSITSGVIPPGQAAMGDFDGDGKPDLVLVNDNFDSNGPTTVQVFYGDGAGHLGNPTQLTDSVVDVWDPNAIGDVDNNGTSDLVMSRVTVGAGGTTSYPQLAFFKGNTNRTLSFSTINTAGGCPGSNISIADYNGDGLNDLIYRETPCTGSGNSNIVMNPATAPGVFSGSEQTVYTTAYTIFNSLVTLKSTQGTRPDVMLTPNTSPNTNAATALVLLENISTGSFPSCGTTAQAEGINLCAPAGASANSPVTFSVSASGPTPMRTVAVWVDGQKVAEQLAHAFSNYSFLDHSITLNPGSHSITIFGTGWDNTLQQKTFNLSAGNNLACGAPSSPGVNICLPVNGSSVGTPTEVSAAANIVGTLARMEIWVDGTKLFTETTSTSFDTTLPLANGYHRFDIFAVNTAGTKYLSTTYATVGPPSTCSADTAYDVHICSPASGAPVTSPVQVTATAHITGTLARMEIWVDAGKVFTETTSNSLNASVTAGAGSHQFAVYAVNTAGTKWLSTVTATVH
jgi:FG-GAP-like repeat/Bacterial Ig domain